MLIKKLLVRMMDEKNIMDKELLSVVTNAIGFVMYGDGTIEFIQISGEQKDKAELAAKIAYNHFMTWAKLHPEEFKAAGLTS